MGLRNRLGLRSEKGESSRGIDLTIGGQTAHWDLYPGYGYWIRFSVSAALTAKTFISEAAIWPKFDPMKKYDFVITVRDRVILCGRSDSRTGLTFQGRSKNSACAALTPHP